MWFSCVCGWMLNHSTEDLLVIVCLHDCVCTVLIIVY